MHALFEYFVFAIDVNAGLTAIEAIIKSVANNKFNSMENVKSGFC